MAVDKDRRKHPETDAFGIVAGFTDAAGAAHTTSEETRAALRAAMGADPHAEAPDDEGGRAVRVVVPGGDVCTACGDRYFSHRARQDSGRQAMLVWAGPSVRSR